MSNNSEVEIYMLANIDSISLMILYPTIWMPRPTANNQNFYLEFNLNLKVTNGKKTS